MSHEKVEPMLAKNDDRSLESLDEENWYAEYKYDGSRLIIQKENGEARAYTRRDTDRTDKLPNLVKEVEENFPDGTIIDGEFAFFDKNDVSHFRPLHTGRGKIQDEGLKPQFIAFDLIKFDGEDLTETELEERKKILEQYRGQLNCIRIAEMFDSNFEQVFSNARKKGREGLIMKKAGSWYYEGSRSQVWKKLKPMQESDFLCVGYTAGEGRRSDYFGSLVLTDGEHNYVGRCGAGFTDKQLEEITEKFEEISREEARLARDEVEGKDWTPVEAFPVEITFQNMTDTGKVRTPSFNRVRDDKPMKDIQPVQELK